MTDHDVPFVSVSLDGLRVLLEPVPPMFSDYMLHDVWDGGGRVDHPDLVISVQIHLADERERGRERERERERESERERETQTDRKKEKIRQSAISVPDTMENNVSHKILIAM